MSRGRSIGKISHLESQVDWLRETGVAGPVTRSAFDEEYGALGPIYRFDLRNDGLIEERDGMIYLTRKAQQNR